MTIHERWASDIFNVSICVNCRNNIGEAKCEAFPDGIPESILSGKNDHSQPLPNQSNEIVFEKKGTIFSL